MVMRPLSLKMLKPFSSCESTFREALEECKKHGSTEEELESSEKLLRAIEREDKMLAELRDIAAEEDLAKLVAAIAIFK